jgi:hypothetical protein
VNLQRTAIGLVTAVALSGGITASAQALPGDPAIDGLSPYRLDGGDLEPGCFEYSRALPGDISDHIDLSLLDAGTLGEDLHVYVDNDAPASVDQVLVADSTGYKVVNTFDTGTSDSDPDIDPGQNATQMNGFTPNGTTSVGATIVCVSDHGVGDNEPYAQEADGMVSAKNRPIIQPEVTRLGVSAIEPLNTYKVGFGYSVEKWYTAPSFDGHSAFPMVTDPLALGNTFNTLPTAVVIPFRLDDLPYDTRRVNDVDAPAEEFDGGDTNQGQNFVFSAEGDDTAWLRNGGTSLLTTITEGDFPVQWSLRASQASPGSLREVTFTHDDLLEWEADWQAYYAGTGAKPSIPLAPGSNSPKPTVVKIINPPESAPLPTPANPNPAPVVNVTPAPVVVNQPAAPTGTKSKSNAKKRAFKKCMKKAKAKSGKAKKRAKRRCHRLPR